MMRRTHAAAGLMIGFGLGAYYQLPLPEAFVIALITETAALIPDLDLKLKIKHRGLTHSLLALFVIAALGFWISFQIQDMKIWMSLAVGYASHLILDMLTVYGIELFYPYHGRIRLMTFRTGGRVDSLFAVASLCAGLWCLWRML